MLNNYYEQNETGRKTFFWYRVYCAVLTLLYLAVGVFGVIVATVPIDSREYSEQELMIIGMIYAVLGGVFFVISAIALFLPPRPYNWIVGIVMMAIGLTSCCFIPFLVPLLIFWMKPETKHFFGRR